MVRPRSQESLNADGARAFKEKMGSPKRQSKSNINKNGKCAYNEVVLRVVEKKTVEPMSGTLEVVHFGFSR